MNTCPNMTITVTPAMTIAADVNHRAWYMAMFRPSSQCQFGFESKKLNQREGGRQV